MSDLQIDGASRNSVRGMNPAERMEIAKKKKCSYAQNALDIQIIKNAQANIYVPCAINHITQCSTLITFKMFPVVMYF